MNITCACDSVVEGRHHIFHPDCKATDADKWQDCLSYGTPLEVDDSPMMHGTEFPNRGVLADGRANPTGLSIIRT